MTVLLFLVSIVISLGVLCAHHRDKEVQRDDGQEYKACLEECCRYVVEVAVSNIVIQNGVSDHGLAHPAKPAAIT